MVATCAGDSEIRCDLAQAASFQAHSATPAALLLKIVHRLPGSMQTEACIARMLHKPMRRDTAADQGCNSDLATLLYRVHDVARGTGTDVYRCLSMSLRFSMPIPLP